MDILYTSICNAPWMFIWVSALLAVVIAQCLIYMKRAWSRALALGIQPADIKKALTTGITISILPTLPVLIVFLSLMPLLGTPLPWLRLSVIGSAAYESYAASVAIECVGEELTLNNYTAYGWIAVAWVMTVGGSACVLWSSLTIKPISILYKKAEKLDMKLVYAIGTGALIGVMAYVSVSQGWGAMSTKGFVFTISFICGAILVFIQKTVSNMKFLSDYLMAISMIAGMAAACMVL